MDEIDVAKRAERFINLRNAYEADHITIDEGHYAFPRFIIPAVDFEKVSWVIDHFEAVEGEIVKLKSTGQDYIRYTRDPSKPDDACHSFV